MLLVRPNMFEDESIGSIVRRVALSNGFQSWREFASALGFTNLELAGPNRRHRFLQKLNALGVDVPVELLRGSSSRFDRIEQKPHTFHAGLSSICPLCLSEHAYARITWERAAYFACHRHAVSMVRQCPRCRMPLDANRLVVEVCPCGFDLRKANVSSASNSEMLGALDIIKSQHPTRIAELEEFAATSKLISSALGAPNYFCRSFEILRAEHPEAHQMMTELATNAVNVLHPRLSLLPFLLADLVTAELATEVLSKLNGMKISRRTKCASEGMLSRAQAGCALGLLPIKSRPNYATNILKVIGINQQKLYPIRLIDKLLRKFWRPGPESHGDGRLERAELMITSRFALSDRSCDGRYLMQSGLSSFYRVEPLKLDNQGLINLHTAASQMNISTRVMNSLIKFGHLRCQVRAGGSARHLWQIEVDEFRKRFVFASALSGLMPLKGGRVHCQLRRGGILPYAGPNVDGMPVYMFERAKIQEYFQLLRE